MKLGSPLRRNSAAMVSTTSSVLIERSTSMLRHSLVYSSTTGIIFSLLCPPRLGPSRSPNSTLGLCARPSSSCTRSRSGPEDREALPFVLLLGYFESCLSPQPIHPLLVDQPTFPPQKGPHPTVAVAGILLREPNHPLGQPAIPLRLAAHVALARPGLADHPARPTLGGPQLLPNVLDGS